MTDLYLFDSSFWIASQKPRVPEPIVERYAYLLRNGKAATNEVVRFELLMGCKGDQLARMARRLDSLAFLELNRQVWDETRSLVQRLRSVGLPKGFPDLLIAATAIHHDLTLVHIDSDYEVIAQHSDLKTESYLEYFDA